ncbi:MAG: DUF4838 domain-containing protein [Ruminococcaceae bacterium]|nr:DUF4838 domain-containing protein [Oscillospiraceae bacterium]
MLTIFGRGIVLLPNLCYNEHTANHRNMAVFKIEGRQIMLKIGRIGYDRTVAFACAELIRIFRSMDSPCFIQEYVYDSFEESKKDTLWIGLNGRVALSDDDEILIDIKDGSGIITASNERAVLIAVYRAAFELGCRFPRPGSDEEIIPKRSLKRENLNVYVSEKASYRHRGVCIEGAVSCEHVQNMIDWLPKVGMNSYFIQFHTPSGFFKRFYNTESPYMEKESVNDEDVKRMRVRIEEEMIKRGLNYHAAGHGWTCEPFGINATNWEQYEGELSEDVRKCLAQVNGKREFWGGIALNTNLCYSNPYVRERMTDAITDYCEEHPAINYLHFWLGDGSNNNCECEECQKMIPSDYYVMLLNELDKKLEKRGITTKIVCLVYVDLLWAPEKNKIENPDRFVLMFAPITRTYTTAFADADMSENITLAPYVRNRLTMPRSVAENMARLSKWQNEQINKDSFDFDYHLMWDHYIDPGYYECSKVLHTDMKNLDKLGLKGMISCQAQRVAFPTGLPMYSMAKALWNKDSEFCGVAEEYFSAAFGDDGEIVREYMSSLSKLFCPPFMRGERPIDFDEFTAQCNKAKAYVNDFEEKYIKPKAPLHKGWKELEYHAEMCRLYADALIARLNGSEEEKEASIDALDKYAERIEMDVHEYFDYYTFKNSLLMRVKGLHR